MWENLQTNACITTENYLGATATNSFDLRVWVQLYNGLSVCERPHDFLSETMILF